MCRNFLSAARRAVAALLLAGLAATAPALAQTSETVAIASVTGGKPLDGTLFIPDGAAPRPAVLVLAPGRGVPEDADRAYARALAQHGFVALAVSYQTNTKNGSPWSPRITTELAGIVDWLRARPETADGPVGAVGFPAGSHALMLSARHPGVGAVIVYYGGYNIRKYAKGGAGIPGLPATLALPIDSAAAIRNAAVLLLHGTADDEIAVRDAEEMRDALQAAGRTVELVTYPGAYHRFDRGNVAGLGGDTSREGFTYRKDPAAAADAFRRSLAWLEAHLGPAAAGANAPALPGNAPTGNATGDAAGAATGAAAEPVGPTGRTPSQVIAGSDRDGDGRVAKSEFRGPPSAFAHIDADGDGFLTRQEMTKAWQ